MSHEITASDDMFSVYEKPWHGLGDVLDATPTVASARQKYLTWGAHKIPLVGKLDDANGQQKALLPVHSKFGIMREDTETVIGVVGTRYKVYQNSDMWDFIKLFEDKLNFTLETAGSLRGGETTWVLCKGEDFEIVSGDPITKYFLFRNAYNGLTPISTLFTNVRVVCSNTLAAAIDGAKNYYNVRHVGDVAAQMREVEKALVIQLKYHDKMEAILQHMSQTSLTETAMTAILNNSIFPFPVTTEPVESSGMRRIITHKATFKELSMPQKRARESKISTILSLVEQGAGADIPGVKGTAYGLFQAVVEWADHERPVRPGPLRTASEAHFETALLSSQQFKTDAMYSILEYAAA